MACSAMREAEESVEFCIARNEGLHDTDKALFDKLGQLLGSLSCSKGMPLTSRWSLRC